MGTRRPDLQKDRPLHRRTGSLKIENVHYWIDTVLNKIKLNRCGVPIQKLLHTKAMVLTEQLLIRRKLRRHFTRLESLLPCPKQFLWKRTRCPDL